MSANASHPRKLHDIPPLEGNNPSRIRERLGLSQSQFARLLGVSVYTLQNWEQGARKPSGAARSLLELVAADPEHAARTLRGRK